MVCRPPTPLVDHRDKPAPGVVVVRVLLHVLGEVHDLLREDGHHDPGRPRVLVALAPLELGGLPGQLVEVRLRQADGARKRGGGVMGKKGGMGLETQGAQIHCIINGVQAQACMQHGGGGGGGGDEAAN